MPFDRVVNNRLLTIYEGSSEDVVSWLRLRKITEYPHLQVCVARRSGAAMPVELYLRETKFEQVLELVREAADVGDPNSYSYEITSRIMDLF